MKLIYEVSELVKGVVEESVNESSNKTDKAYYITGIFSTIGEKNRNGRIYSREIWEKEIERYSKEVANNSRNSLMEWEHPERSYVDQMAAIAKIVEIKIEGKYVIGKAKLLNNERANHLKNLIDEGVPIGVSSRGVGEVGEGGIVKKFKLITYDGVPSESDYNAETKGIKESWNNGILESNNYDLDELGNIVYICDDDSCIREHRDVVDKAIVQRLSEILKK